MRCQENQRPDSNHTPVGGRQQAARAVHAARERPIAAQIAADVLVALETLTQLRVFQREAIGFALAHRLLHLPAPLARHTQALLRALQRHAQQLGAHAGQSRISRVKEMLLEPRHQRGAAGRGLLLALLQRVLQLLLAQRLGHALREPVVGQVRAQTLTARGLAFTKEADGFGELAQTQLDKEVVCGHHQLAGLRAQRREKNIPPQGCKRGTHLLLVGQVLEQLGMLHLRLERAFGKLHGGRRREPRTRDLDTTRSHYTATDE